jgi:PQQ enzyme repeat/PQQ-like domain
MVEICFTLRNFIMHKCSRPLALLAVGCSVAAGSWLTFGGDSQRSGWAKDETIISPDSVKGLQLLWKLSFDNQPKELNALTPPVVINPVYTNHGADTYVVVAGSSDNLYVVDADTGKMVWQKRFTNTAPPPSGPQSSGSYFCPNALNDTPVIQTEGSAGPTAYVISIDGKLHALNMVNGEDRFPPQQFVPAYSKNWSLNLAGNFIYTTTSQGCGQAKSGVWAMNLASPDRPVTSFQADPVGGGIWGRGGAAIGSSGAIYAETGDGPFDPATNKYADTFLALSPKDLKLLDYFTPSNATYLTRKDLDMGNSTPVVLPYKGRELLVGSGKEGVLFLLDGKSLGGETHRKPLFQSPLYTNEGADIAGRGFWGAFATWEDAKGTRWVCAPAWGPASSKAPPFPVTNGPVPNGSIMAFKVEEKDGQPALVPGWTSRDMALPEPPIVANGIVFSISSGEFTRQFNESGRLYTAQERIQQSTGNATLYAFDAQTGKELFSSGKTMSSFTHLGGIAVSDGRVYATTHDSTLYAFGLKDQ